MSRGSLFAYTEMACLNIGWVFAQTEKTCLKSCLCWLCFYLDIRKKYWIGMRWSLPKSASLLQNLRDISRSVIISCYHDYHGSECLCECKHLQVKLHCFQCQRAMPKCDEEKSNFSTFICKPKFYWKILKSIKPQVW